jgi:hypothetical protein
MPRRARCHTIIGGCVVFDQLLGGAAQPSSASFRFSQSLFDLRCVVCAAAQMLGQQGVTAHGAVVVHAVQRVFAVKSHPFAVAPQLQQPVGAQAVFLVRP